MTDEDAPYTVALNIDGPRDPGYLLEVLEAFAEAARVANHLTLSHEALEYPSELDVAVRYVATAASRLPQLCGQLGSWLRQERHAGRLRAGDGEYEGRPDMAAVAACMRLEEAAALASALQEALDGAAAVTSTLGAVETEGERDG